MNHIFMNKIISVKWMLLCIVMFFSAAVQAKTNHLELIVNNQNHTLEISSQSFVNYQWFKDGEELLGANSADLSITESGVYTVLAQGVNGEIYEQEAQLLVTAAGTIIKIYTIGDSTVQDYTAGYYPRKGWGQVLPAFFNTANVQVVNKAAGGTSSKSFYNNHWAAVRNVLNAGDFVFIQFGINDRNSADTARYAPTGGVFEGYLTKFINETKAKGAFPVLVSTARRNSWNADGVTVYDAYHDHPVAVRTVAKNLNVPLIDLDAKAKIAMEAAGKGYCTRFWHNNYVAGEYANYPNGNTDDVHFQEMGAINNASLIVQGIKELSADVNVSKLIPYINPQYQYAVTVNPATGSDSLTTRTAYYPAGLTITLKTIPKNGKSFQKWNNATGTQVSAATLTTVTSATSATSFTAMYVGAVTTTDCNNVINGTARLDNCDRCVGGTTGKTACNALAEAETEACSFDGIVENINVGYKGTGYINGNNAIGSKITFNINASTAGNKIISFRYANGSTNDRTATVLVNGVALSNTLGFPSTSAFTTYKTVEVTLSLIAGNNKIELASVLAEGLANIDQIGYVSTGLSKGGCVVTAVGYNTETNEVLVFPNPTDDSFKLHAPKPFDVEIFNSNGSVLITKNALTDLEFGNDFKSGVYFVKLSDGATKRVFKIVKQ